MCCFVILKLVTILLLLIAL